MHDLEVRATPVHRVPCGGRVRPGTVRRARGAIGIAVSGILVCAVVGCRTASPAGRANPAQAQAPAEGVDPTRAYLTLDQIQPVPQVPAAADIKPLSSRGQEQLAKAVALEKEQRYSEALEELQRGLGFDPRHPTLLGAQARLFFRSGSTERAKAAAAAVLQSDPASADMHELLGRMCLADGQANDAMSEFRAAVMLAGKKSNERPLLHYLLGDALDRLGYLTAARAEFMIVDVWLRQGSPVDGDLSALINVDGGAPDLRAADIQDRLGHPELAAAIIQQRIDAGKATDEDRIRCARLLLKARRPDDAWRIAAAIISDSPKSLALLGDIRRSQGRGEAVFDDLHARLAASPQSTRLALALADAAESLDRRDRGIAELRAFLDRNPRDAEVRERLVRMLIAQKQWNDILPICAKAIEDEPALTWAMLDRMHTLGRDEEASRAILSAGASSTLSVALLRAELALARHDPARAAAELARFEDKVAGSAPARYVMARACLEQFDWAKARSLAARRDPEVAEDPRLEWVLAEAAVGLDDPQQAELHYKAALQLDRTDERSMLELARLYADSGRGLQAEKQLRTLLELNPRDGDAREMLMGLYLEAGRLDEVSRQLQELDRRQPASNALARCLAEVQRRQGVEARAYRALLQDAISRNGADSPTLLALGDAQTTEGALDAARTTYEQALKLNPHDDDAMLRLVGVDELSLDFNAARQRLMDLLAWFPNRHGLRIELIHVLAALGQFDEALSVALGVLEQPELNEAARTAYRDRALDLLSAMRRDDDRVALLARFAEAEPGHGPWTRRWVETLIDLNRVDDALAAARQAYDASKERLDGELVVNALIAGGRTDRALQMVLDWQSEDPDDEAITGLLASKLVLCERYDEALDLLDNLLLTTSNPERVRERIFRVNRAAGRHEDNVRFLEDWIADMSRLSQREFARNGATPDRIQADLDDLVELLHTWIVQEMMLAEQLPAAQARIGQLLEATADPSRQFDLLVLSYNCHQLSGDEAQSLAVLDQCHKLKPQDVGTCNDLAYLLAERGERLDEAEELARLAVGRAPRNMAYLDTLGWVLYKKGRLDEAFTWLSRAVQAERRDDADVHEHLGDVTWRLGQREEAVLHWQEGLKMATKGDEDDRRSRATTERIEQKLEAVKGGRVPEIARTQTDGKEQ